jgi:DDE superfamily endonuclease
VAGTILAPRRRTVSSALRAVGMDQQKRFHRYHRVLSRATWSSREGSCVLLRLLVRAFVAEGPPVLGIDETLERRWGPKIRAKDVYPPPLREGQRAEVDLRDVARPPFRGLNEFGPYRSYPHWPIPNATPGSGVCGTSR